MLNKVVGPVTRYTIIQCVCNYSHPQTSRTVFPIPPLFKTSPEEVVVHLINLGTQNVRTDVAVSTLKLIAF